MATFIILKTFGFVWAGMGLAFLLSPKPIHQGLQDLFASKGLTLLTGLVTLILGAVMLAFHCKPWDTPWEKVVTIVSWIAFVKGILYIAYPKGMTALKQKMLPSPSVLRLYGLIILLIGGYLCHTGQMGIESLV